MYSRYLIPAIRYKLTVHDISATNLTKLDILCDKFIKGWLSMPQSGTRAVIHMPEALNIKSISHLYKECHATSHATSRLKADDAVNLALDCKLQHESKWVRKDSVTVYSENHYHTAVELCDSNSRHTYIESIKRKIKQNINIEFSDMWYNHVKSLTVQGRFLELLRLENNHVTWRSLIYNLPKGVLQFAINASIDTLSTNANLKRWGKRRNAKCDSCGQRETLHHVLNHCECLMERYTWRHNSILSFIISQITPDGTDSVYSDLAGMMTGCSTIPTDVTITSQRPDLVVVNRQNKTVTILELSVPFELNVESTHARKVDRYQGLINDIEDNNFTVKYYPIEIGSRGYINSDNVNRLKSFIKNHAKDSKLSTCKDMISKISLVCSFIIFHSKFERDWISPAYVKF